MNTAVSKRLKRFKIDSLLYECLMMEGPRVTKSHHIGGNVSIRSCNLFAWGSRAGEEAALWIGRRGGRNRMSSMIFTNRRAGWGLRMMECSKTRCYYRFTLFHQFPVSSAEHTLSPSHTQAHTDSGRIEQWRCPRSSGKPPCGCEVSHRGGPLVPELINLLCPPLSSQLMYLVIARASDGDAILFYIQG